MGSLNKLPRLPAAGPNDEFTTWSWLNQLQKYISTRWTGVYSVMTYGAKGDGVTDDTNAFQAAHDAMGATGGTIYIPAGTYNIVGTLTISKACTIQGDGFGVSILSKGAGTGDMFSMTGTYQRLTGLRIVAGVAQTAGAYIELGATTAKITIDNLLLDGWFRGILNGGLSSFRVTDCVILDGVVTTGVGYYQTSNAADVKLTRILIDNPSGSQPFAGLRFDKCADATLVACSMIHCITGLYLAPQTAGMSVTSLWASNSFFDNCSTNGVLIDPNNTATVARCRFSDCWFSSAGSQGIVVSSAGGGTTTGIDIVNCHGFLNTFDAIGVLVATEVHILGGEFAQNGRDGIRFGATPTAFSVIGARSGNCGGLNGNTGQGINIVNAGSTNYRILDNDLRGNTAGALSDTGVAPKIIANNLGV